jgi:paraquat-inducible protein B
MAMERQTTIGAFVLGGIVLALGAIVFFGNFRLFSPTRRAAIVFQGSVSGLSVGAPVTFRGVRVGAVDSITIQFDARTQTAFIPVTLQLDPGRVRVTRDAQDRDFNIDLDSLIQRGLRAELNTQSFVTGQSEINLDFDPSSAAVLHPDITQLTEIPTRASTIERVTQQISQLPLRELADNADAALKSIRTLSDKLDTSLPALIDSLKATSDGSSHAIDAATKAITDLQGRLDTTLGHFSQLAIDANQTLTQRSADLHTLLVTTNQTVQQTHETLNDLRSLTSNRGEARANIEATLRDLAASAASLRGFASDVEHNPQLLLTGRRQ